MNINTKRKLIKLGGSLYRFYQWGKKVRARHSSPKKIAERRYINDFGCKLNWEHPTEFNEKIRWMQFYTDTTKWSLLADKYRVREHIDGKGYGNILVKLYGMWKRAEDIDFDSLPNQFVLKTNHGYGEVLIVEDKNKMNLNVIRRKMKHFLNTPFGYESAEMHYLKIKPVIIAEELLKNDDDWSSSIVDYKFYCFKGEPFCCAVFFNRDIYTHRKCAEIYDMEWKRHDEWLHENYKPEIFIDIPRPKCLNKMIKACHDLASDFPFVRMDMYVCGNRYYFGEYTFTPAALGGGSINKELSEKLALLLELPPVSSIAKQP